MSAITPPQLTSGLDAKTAAKNRQMIVRMVEPSLSSTEGVSRSRVIAAKTNIQGGKAAAYTFERDEVNHVRYCSIRQQAKSKGWCTGCVRSIESQYVFIRVSDCFRRKVLVSDTVVTSSFCCTASHFSLLACAISILLLALLLLSLLLKDLFAHVDVQARREARHLAQFVPVLVEQERRGRDRQPDEAKGAGAPADAEVGEPACGGRKRQCGSAGGELTEAASSQAHIWRMKSGNAAAAVL